MFEVVITIPCVSHNQARGIKRQMDFHLAGLFYHKEVSALLSSEILQTGPPPASVAGVRVDARKRMTLVPKPNKGGANARQSRTE